MGHRNRYVFKRERERKGGREREKRREKGGRGMRVREEKGEGRRGLNMQLKNNCILLVCLLAYPKHFSGKCISRFTNGKTPYCIKFNPDEDKQHLFVVGCADKKIYTVRIIIKNTITLPLPFLSPYHLYPLNLSFFIPLSLSLSHSLSLFRLSLSLSLPLPLFLSVYFSPLSLSLFLFS